MSKLYVFAVGGTGARVVKALTHLLAAGVKLVNNYEVVPILIDPHQNNENLKQTRSLLNIYRDLHVHRQEETDFFRTSILSIEDLADNGEKNAGFSMNSIKELSFKDFLDLGSLPDATRQLMELLYSEKDLKTKMD
ncbi:MAG: hypothetical protein WBA74_09675, partial [Cyclobacteriaceae bacterium]